MSIPMSDPYIRSLERRRRIFLSLAAYAYEYTNNLLMNDGDYDELSRRINPNQETIEDYYDTKQKERVQILDKFFKHEFQPDTGMWIGMHPELDRLESRYYHVTQHLNIKSLPLI